MSVALDRPIPAVMEPDTWLTTKDWMTTYMGYRFYPMAPYGPVDIRDIAHALSNLCRYAGHARLFYSVAEHSVRMAEIIADRMRDVGMPFEATIRYAFQALVHDATEAYLIDLPRPIKMRPEFAPYRAAEKRLDRYIRDRLQFPGYESDTSEIVKALDTEILGTEFRRLFDHEQVPEGLPPPINARGTLGSFGWAPVRAERLFISAYRRLCAGVLP